METNNINNYVNAQISETPYSCFCSLRTPLFTQNTSRPQADKHDRCQNEIKTAQLKIVEELRECDS